MNLFHLRYFLKLAEEQHFTRTAEKLCITQPSLSNAMAQLEKELGVHLFEKTEDVSASPFTDNSFSNASKALSQRWTAASNPCGWHRRETV